MYVWVLNQTVLSHVILIINPSKVYSQKLQIIGIHWSTQSVAPTVYVSWHISLSLLEGLIESFTVISCECELTLTREFCYNSGHSAFSSRPNDVKTRMPWLEGDFDQTNHRRPS